MMNSVHDRELVARRHARQVFVAAEARRLAIPRVAKPDEITRLVLFVASDEASFSTGSEFIVDGGVLLGPAPQHERAEATLA